MHTQILSQLASKCRFHQQRYNIINVLQNYFLNRRDTLDNSFYFAINYYFQIPKASSFKKRSLRVQYICGPQHQHESKTKTFLLSFIWSVRNF